MAKKFFHCCKADVFQKVRKDFAKLENNLNIINRLKLHKYGSNNVMIIRYGIKLSIKTENIETIL